jgi:hypothetical protein
MRERTFDRALDRKARHDLDRSRAALGTEPISGRQWRKFRKQMRRRAKAAAR